MRSGWKQFRGGFRVIRLEPIFGEPCAIAPPLSERFVLPLRHHIGEAAKPVVRPGDKVLRGQQVARPAGDASVPVHAPTSGTIIEQTDHPVPHPSGLSASCLIIAADGADREAGRLPIDDYASQAPAVIRDRIRDAAIVGLGGAGFPTFIKLRPFNNRVIDTLIVNGVECDPFISCDDSLIREHPSQVLEGTRIMRHALQARKCVIALEDDKPEALDALQAQGADDVEVVTVPAFYPVGDERILINVLSGREVPSEGLPAQIGFVVQNVATAVAVYRAVVQGEPMTSRYVTIGGNALECPRNLDVRFGTPIADLLDFCGVRARAHHPLTIGGVMMGFALQSSLVPVTTIVNSIMVEASEDSAGAHAARSCIRCGDCAEVCPMRLLPQQLYWHSRAHDLDSVQKYHIFDCTECGCCAYVCPSRIPLTQYFRFAKDAIRFQEKEREQADRSRRRYRSRNERLERERREKEAIHERKMETMRKNAISSSSKQAMVQAVVNRVKTRRCSESRVSDPKQPDSADIRSSQSPDASCSSDRTCGAG